MEGSGNQLADTFANGDQRSRWGPLPGMQEHGAVDTSPAGIRWFIELLNHVLIENYRLRQELVQTRSSQDQLFEITVAVPGSEQERVSGHDIREHGQPGVGVESAQDGTEFQAPAEDKRSSLRHWSGDLADTSHLVSREEHDRIVGQIEALGDEIQSLRLEMRSALWRIPVAQQPQRAPQPEAQSPRFERIQSVRSDVTFEADPHPGMWMKLRRPWFYLPLIWITLLGLAALAAFLIFFN